MRLLLTRPREDADMLAALLAARGHRSVIAPVMDVRFREGPELALEGVQAVIATSANGVRALAARSARRDLLLYAVGPQTAEAARAAGFARVTSAEGDAAALIETVATTADPAGGTLLHAAGTETAGRLTQTLQSRGFTMEAAVLYEAAPLTALAIEAADALRASRRSRRLERRLRAAGRILHQRGHRRGANRVKVCARRGGERAQSTGNAGAASLSLA
jgi:uroporphyrinogen-III synthase